MLCRLLGLTTMVDPALLARAEAISPTKRRCIMSINANSCSNPAEGEGTAPGTTTGPFGRWGHHYAECSTACENGGQCQVTGTQHYFVNGFPINQSYTMTCTSITADGH